MPGTHTLSARSFRQTVVFPPLFAREGCSILAGIANYPKFQYMYLILQGYINITGFAVLVSSFKFHLLLPQEVTSFFKGKTTTKINHPKNNKMKILKHNQRRHAKLAYKISFIKNKINGLHFF
jgi:hypothetical protein